MRRRDFITLLGGAAAELPLVVRAQPAMIRVGILQASLAGLLQQYLAQFRKGLSKMGYVEGRNLALECRGKNSHHFAR
jgi:putative tryptophan/tyrosine transport system substrate-binding protein